MTVNSTVSVFGTSKTSTRLVSGMASLPLGVCVVLDEISA
jgi:hypothetical protein